MSGDHIEPTLQHTEGLGHLGVAVVGVTKKALCVVRLRVVPYAFIGVSSGLDAMTGLAQPTLASSSK